MAKLLDCSPEVSEFELSSRYYVHFRKGMSSLILYSHGLNSITAVVFGIR